MQKTHSNTVAAMDSGKSSGNWLRELDEQQAPSRRLPKHVRFLGEAPAETDGAAQLSIAMCEFEVVTGNAAYKEGERFYLTSAQAKRAYHLADQRW